MNFETIESAIKARIQTELPYLRTLETYAGQLEDEIDKLVLSFPAVFVAYQGSSFEWVDGETYNETAEFVALVAAKNLKSGAAIRTDPVSGAYRLIKDVAAALTNQNLGLDIERLRPTQRSLVYSSKTAIIYGLNFQTNFDAEFPAE